MLKTCESNDLIHNLIALLLGGSELKRDDDYLRDLLQAMEQSDSWLHGTTESLLPDVDGDPNKRVFHMLLLVDEGMLAPHGGRGYYRITNQGHDFLSLTRDKSAWEHVKRTFKNVSGQSIQMMLRVAEAYATEKLVSAGAL